MIKKYTSIFMLSSLLISCGNSTSEVESITADVETTESESDPEEDKMEMYSKDWTKFKKAVADKDIRGVSAFASSDEIDAETLIMLLSMEPYRSGLAKAKFEDQTINKTEEGRTFEFNISETGMDDEGNEVGSAVSVFFTLGKKGLELDYYVAAG